MVKTAQVEELAKHLPEFLDEVGAGHEVVVIRGRQAVARLVPMAGGTRGSTGSMHRLTPLSGKWVGEPVLRSGDLAQEMFSGRSGKLLPRRLR
jgi:antitoxin (DNA-binding transcriptional repressor) of toxin-antitoxin stability system